MIVIRYKYHEVFSRIRLAPDWVFYLCAALGFIASFFGVFVTFWSPWTNTPTKTLMSTLQWDLWIGGIGVLSLIIGAALFFVGRATIRRDVSDEQIIAEVTGDRAIATE